MREKKTKGKQKIKIKKIEKDEDRMVTFSKRRTGIYTKLSELSILCGVDVAFLVFSGAGKPYTFGSPSFVTVAERFLNGNLPRINGEGSSSSSSIVDAHKKMKMEELCKTYNDLVEEVDAEEQRGMTTAAEAPTLAVESEAWWRKDPKDVKEEEEAIQLMRKYEDLYEKLCEVAATKSHEGGSSRSSFAGNNG